MEYVVFSGTMKYLDSFTWPMVALVCATRGLAPFTPEPHVWEKLKMLFAGELNQGIDIFDLMMHGLPWVILVAKLTRHVTQKRAE